MISLTDFKTYLLGRGFQLEGNSLVKEFQMPIVENEEPKTIKLKYTITRPWVKGFRIDSIGREKLFSKGKLKNISIGLDGNLEGFLIKQSQGGNVTWN